MLYGIIADIHSNLEALECALAALRQVETIICVGDIVGYGPDPGPCIDLLQSQQVKAIAGNHDKAALGELSTQWFNRDARLAIEWTAEQLSEKQKVYLRALPERLELEEFELVHGSLRDPLEEYIFNMDEAAATIELMRKPLCFVGHTHRPMYVGLKPSGSCDGRMLGNRDQVFVNHYTKAIINPGSIGQPRDGDFRASYGIYDSDKKEFTLSRIEYNIPAVQEKMRKAGLADFLIERLASGN